MRLSCACGMRMNPGPEKHAQTADRIFSRQVRLRSIHRGSWPNMLIGRSHEKSETDVIIDDTPNTPTEREMRNSERERERASLRHVKRYYFFSSDGSTQTRLLQVELVKFLRMCVFLQTFPSTETSVERRHSFIWPTDFLARTETDFPSCF